MMTRKLNDCKNEQYKNTICCFVESFVFNMMTKTKIYNIKKKIKLDKWDDYF